MAILIEQIINGVIVGTYFTLLALGLSLIFSLGGIVNLAHGAFYAIGAYIAVELDRQLGYPLAFPVEDSVAGLDAPEHVVKPHATDAGNLAGAGTNCVVVGAAEPGEAHTAEESVSIAVLERCERIYRGVAERFGALDR